MDSFWAKIGKQIKNISQKISKYKNNKLAVKIVIMRSKKIFYIKKYRKKHKNALKFNFVFYIQKQWKMGLS